MLAPGTARDACSRGMDSGDNLRMTAFRGLCLVALAAAGGLLGAASASAQPRDRGEARSVVLANRHLAVVQQVYLSPVTSSDWGPDRLGADTLAVGDEVTVEMRGGCQADLRIVFANAGAEERRAVDICETTRIVLRPGWAVAEELDAEGPVVVMPGDVPDGALRLRNAGRLPIVELYAGPPGGARGEDRLGTEILAIGASIDIEPADPDACAADLVAVFRDGREVTRTGVDLCAGEEIEIR
jgi:hypothetical protein